MRNSMRAVLPMTVALLAAAAGCSVKTETQSVAGSLARRPTCEAVIRTFDSRAQVPNDYYEVAFIEAEGNSVYTTDKQLREEIRKRAAEVGATAVIANPVSEANTAVKVLGEALGTNSATAKTSALAIYMPADADRLAQLCGIR